MTGPLVIFLDAVVHQADLPMKKLKSLLKQTRIVRLFVWKGILKSKPLSSKIHCYVKNRNGLYLKRYRSDCKKCEVFTKGKSKISSKTREGLSVV